MKKLTALFLALLLVFSLGTVFSAAADENDVAIVLVPEDETLLTAEGLALFFADRDAITEETETSVSWYKETTTDGKTERELVEEMPLVLKPAKGGAPARIYVASGYTPPQEITDLLKAYMPETDAESEHTYRYHRVFSQDCRTLGLRYGACSDCFGIEFDLGYGPHSYGSWTDLGDRHVRSCTVCGHKADKTEEHSSVIFSDDLTHMEYCPDCGHVFWILVEPTIAPTVHPLSQ